MAWSGLRYGVMPTQISWAFGGLLWGFAMFRCSKQHSDQHFLVASEGFEPPHIGPKFHINTGVYGAKSADPPQIPHNCFRAHVIQTL